jgi:hypothetical protein
MVEGQGRRPRGIHEEDAPLNRMAKKGEAVMNPWCGLEMHVMFSILELRVIYVGDLQENVSRKYA